MPPFMQLYLRRINLGGGDNYLVQRKNLVMFLREANYYMTYLKYFCTLFVQTIKNRNFKIMEGLTSLI